MRTSKPEPAQDDAKPMANSKKLNQDNPMSETESDAVASAVRTLDVEGEGLKALSAALRDGLGNSFRAAVKLIREAPGRVIVTGMGKSGHVARKIAATLASTGTPAFFIHAGDAGHGDLGMITKNDVVLALSWSGESAELKSLIDYTRRFRIGLIGLTAGSDSTLGKSADVTLGLPEAREACPHNLAPTTSSLMQLAMGDALAIALLESRGFTALQFGIFHPAGKLGAALKFVRDLMHTGETMPMVPLGTPMSKAVVEMTGKGFGFVGVTDAHGMLMGVITDGDLRRHMNPQLLEKRVDEVMLEILNASKITALVVAEGKRPVGIVHLHDLLRAGVA
jgi:arabinose-5-phosphate isomerase